MFRTRQETSRVTKILDAHGNKRVIRKHVKMGLIKHVNIIAALEMIALRYHNKGHAKSDQDEILYDESMDETGTIDIAELSDFDADALGEQYQKILTHNNIEFRYTQKTKRKIKENRIYSPLPITIYSVK